MRPLQTIHPPDSPHTSASLTFLILALGACGMAGLLALLPAAGHDQMWLLYAARLMLHGAPPYGPQVFETNPPLILWLSAIPAALAPLTHLPDTALGKFFVLALEFAVGSLCLRLLRVSRPSLTRSSVWAFAFVFITVVAVMPARDFGQRDHLLTLFILPYLFAAALRGEDRPIPSLLALLIGILALAGLVLKPHQLLIPVAVEAALLFFPRIRPTASSPFRRILRPEIAAIFFAGLAFLYAIHRFAPLYFSTIVPIERETYWAYGRLTRCELFAQSIQLHLLLALDLLLAGTLGWRRTSVLARIFLIAGAAAIFAFYLQGTGWYYQQIPALTFLAFAFALILLDLTASHRISLPRWSASAAASLSLLALALTAHFMNYPFTADRSFPIDRPDPTFFKGLPAGAAVLTLSPTVDDTIQPIYKFHLTLGERYPALLMLPAILRSQSFYNHTGPTPKHIIPPARLAELDRLQHAYMVEDLNRWRPQLILVQRCQVLAVHCQVLEDRHDDLLAFFLRDPAFRQIFAHYRLLRTSGPYDAYTLQ